MSSGSSYRPQSPDLSSYAPQSPNLSAYRPQSPDLSGLTSPTFNAQFAQPPTQHRQLLSAEYSNGFADASLQYQPTSIPAQPGLQYAQYPPPNHPMAPSQIKAEDQGVVADAPPSKRSRKHAHHGDAANASNGDQGPARLKSERGDPTLGVQLRTSFPVARIKRIMQADEDIGKVAQVTPHVVSRALELFMIKLITASAENAGGTGPAGATATAAKGPRRVLAQHMKRAVQADDTFDFLADIMGRVPDAPSKAKKEANSDSEDAKPKKRGKKRKDSTDDF